MKKCFFAIAAIVLCGCSKEMIQSSEEKGDAVEFTFAVPVSATKVSGSTVEDAVESLQIFVFGEDGQIQAAGMAQTNSLKLTCTTGDKIVAALVNAPEVVGVSTIDELRRRQSDFGDNSLGRFVMAGAENKTLNASGEVQIEVSRLVSKVSLVSVENAFELPQHQQMEFSLMSVFMMNVPQDASYLGTTVHDSWIGLGSGDLLYDSLGDVSLRYSQTGRYGNYMYCYPNTYDDEDNKTYLVVEASLGDGIYYYNVALPKMESNKCYNISMKVTRPGSLSPDEPIRKEDAVFSVSVADWAGNINVNETI